MVEFYYKEWRLGKVHKTVDRRLDQHHFTIRHAMEAKVSIGDVKPVIMSFMHMQRRPCFSLEIIMVLLCNTFHLLAKLLEPKSQCVICTTLKRADHKVDTGPRRHFIQFFAQMSFTLLFI